MSQVVAARYSASAFSWSVQLKLQSAEDSNPFVKVILNCGPNDMVGVVSAVEGCYFSCLDSFFGRVLLDWSDVAKVKHMVQTMVKEWYAV